MWVFGFFLASQMFLLRQHIPCWVVEISDKHRVLGASLKVSPRVEFVVQGTCLVMGLEKSPAPSGPFPKDGNCCLEDPGAQMMVLCCRRGSSSVGCSRQTHPCAVWKGAPVLMLGGVEVKHSQKKEILAWRYSPLEALMMKIASGQKDQSHQAWSPLKEWVNEAGWSGMDDLWREHFPRISSNPFPFDKRPSFESEIRFCAHAKQGERAPLNLPRYSVCKKKKIIKKKSIVGDVSPLADRGSYYQRCRGSDVSWGREGGEEDALLSEDTLCF